ncbi:MAG: starch-binding protein [Ruminococcus sp.]|nr:starch-binding protein [Ruminococcus sp.]
MKRSIRAVTAAALAALIVLSAFMSMTVFAAGNTLSYSFSGEDSSRAGYAQGTITLTAAAGTYYLYWADDTKALEGYDKLCSLTFSSAGSKTHTMVKRSAIPADATKLIATTSLADKTVANASAVYNIPDSKRWNHKSVERKYRFASYSDVHIDGTYKTYEYADEHWRDALDTAAARDAEFIVISGDYVNNNIDCSGISGYEWRTYERVLSESNYLNPVYEAIGNHELWQDVNVGTNDFKRATGLSGSDGNTSSKAYFEKTINGDHFIFMAMEGGFYPDRTDEFTETQLNWLEELLNKYSGDGHNIYIIEHSLFYKYGAGDRADAEPYYDIPLKEGAGTGNNRFKTILNNHKDVIFLSGHTHIAFKEQYNFSDNNGTSAQMIHNSSVGGTRTIENGALNRDYSRDRTEGYIVDVFDDAIIFNGANLYNNIYDPNCCYVVKPSSEFGTKKSAQAKGKNSTGATATSYYLKGSFNSWGTANPFYTTSDSNTIETTIQLSAGTYEFKLNNGSTWYGNTGTINDTTTTSSTNGWIMSASAGNCKLTASGGYYTFNFNTSNSKLKVFYSTTDPNAATSPTQATQETQPTQASQEATQPVNCLPGDVDGNEKVTIRDATYIQLYLVNRYALSNLQKKAADVNRDGTIDINDVTFIQMNIAGLVADFSETYTAASESTRAAAKNNLSLYYRYSSYDVYQNLKTAYTNGFCEDALSQANADLLAVADPDNVDSSGSVTVFFEKPDSWGAPNAYCWGRKGAGNEGDWPGNAMTYVGKNEYGKSIYKYVVKDSKHNFIIFNNGSNQTGDIVISDSYTAYYLDGSNNVVSYRFNDSYIVNI